jgi:hypothetical protein
MMLMPEETGFFELLQPAMGIAIMAAARISVVIFKPFISLPP